MDDGEAAQLPASFFQEPALATTGLATASFWDGYADGSQKTHVQVGSLWLEGAALQLRGSQCLLAVHGSVKVIVAGGFAHPAG